MVTNTSPLQYLHQIGMLPLLPRLAPRILVPPAVVEELEAGTARGIDLPRLAELPWIEQRPPSSASVLPLVTDLGPGETQVLALCLELGDATALLDDGLARRVALALDIRVRGTLGVLIDAKRAGLVSSVSELLDRLDALRFRVARHTREAVQRLAGEHV